MSMLASMGQETSSKYVEAGHRDLVQLVWPGVSWLNARQTGHTHAVEHLLVAEEDTL